MFITSAPTLIPSPSPMTFAPTNAPSFIGLVISVDFTTSTTASFNDSEVFELESIIVQSYGVDEDSLSTSVEYNTAGTMTISVPADMSSDEAVSILTDMFAKALLISEDDISLFLDSETDEVSYTITSSDYESASNVLDTLQIENILNVIDTESDGVIINSLHVIDEIIGAIIVTVDADEVSIPLQQADNTIDALLGDAYEYTTKSNNFFSPTHDYVF